MLRLRSLSSQLQQPQLAKGRSALFFIKHLQLKSLLKQVEAGELEMIGINWRSENRVEHRFIIASSSLHHRFNLSPSKAQVDHLREEVADLRPSAAQQYPRSSLGHWDTGRSLDDLQGKTLQQRETFLAQVLSSKRDFHASLVASLVPLFSEATWICLKYPVPQIHWLIILFPVKHCHFADIFGYTTFSVTPQGSHFFPLPGDQTKTKTICDANICLKHP